MTTPPRIPEDRLDHELERDTAAFQDVTSRNLPDLNLLARRVRHRSLRSGKETLMGLARQHPFVVPLLTIAVLLLVLLFPISFDRTTGHDVTMRVTGGTLDAAAARAIAQEWKAQLGAEHVEVAADQRDDSSTFTFTANVPANAGANARSVAAAFEKMLEAQDLGVTTSVMPRVERVSGPMVAYAADRVVRIETEGKSASQIESEIRSALEDAGMTNVQVSVTDLGGGKRDVEVNAQRDAQSGDAAGEGPVEIVLDGEPVDDADRVSVNVRKMKDDAGNVSMTIDVLSEGREVEVVVPNPDSMSDPALESEIERQLSQAGVDLDVTVSGGRVSVEPR